MEQDYLSGRPGEMMQCDFCAETRSDGKIFSCKVCGQNYCLTDKCDAAHAQHCKLSARLGAGNRGVRCDFCGERWIDNQYAQLISCCKCESRYCATNNCVSEHDANCDLVARKHVAKSRMAANLPAMKDGVSILTPSYTEIDNRTATAFSQEIEQGLSHDCPVIIIDLSNVGFLSSAAIGALNKLKKHRRDIGQALRLIFQRNRIPYKFINIAGFRSFECYQNLEDARTGVNRVMDENGLNSQ